jgi:hypothetical protein
MEDNKFFFSKDHRQEQGLGNNTLSATGLRCPECKHKNTVTVGNGWSKTRCRLEPHKEFYQIENDNSCRFQLNPNVV